MPVIQTSIFNVIERFPGCKDSILQFFRENQNFQTICDDYRLCAESLKRSLKVSIVVYLLKFDFQSHLIMFMPASYLR